MGKKVLVVVSNHQKLGTTDKKTGWYLPEVAHPYEVFKEAGYDVTFISPCGKAAPMDESSFQAFKDDPSCKKFLEKDVKQLENTKQAKDVKAKDYSGIFYAGGHGPMFDLPDAKDIAGLGAEMYEFGKILGAVCHGTVGFVPVKVKKNGEECDLVKGETVTSFTNAEEDAVQLSNQMPFMLETRLKDQGANFVAGADWSNNVQESNGRLVTGQNPASATDTAKKMVELMNKL